MNDGTKDDEHNFLEELVDVVDAGINAIEVQKILEAVATKHIQKYVSSIEGLGMQLPMWIAPVSAVAAGIAFIHIKDHNGFDCATRVKEEFLGMCSNGFDLALEGMGKQTGVTVTAPEGAPKGVGTH